MGWVDQRPASMMVRGEGRFCRDQVLVKINGLRLIGISEFSLSSQNDMSQSTDFRS